MNQKLHLDSVIIVAGGIGKRMKSTIPKQFMILKDMPILMHTIHRFHSFDNTTEIILVIPKKDFNYWDDLCKEYSFTIKHKIVAGGIERFYSVKYGLDNLKAENGIVAIHDGVRPMVDYGTILRGVETALKFKAAVPVVPVTNSIRIIEGCKNRNLERNLLRVVQTPQIFDIKLIKEAYRTEFDPFFTDDASVIEKHGGEVFLYKGNPNNIKITTKLDLEYLKLMLNQTNNT